MAAGRGELCLFSNEPQIERRRACELLRVGTRPRRAAKNVGREPMHLRERRGRGRDVSTRGTRDGQSRIPCRSACRTRSSPRSREYPRLKRRRRDRRRRRWSCRSLGREAPPARSGAADWIEPPDPDARQGRHARCGGRSRLGDEHERERRGPSGSSWPSYLSRNFSSTGRRSRRRRRALPPGDGSHAGAERHPRQHGVVQPRGNSGKRCAR